jgi:hypothetical protein
MAAWLWGGALDDIESAQFTIQIIRRRLSHPYGPLFSSFCYRGRQMPIRVCSWHCALRLYTVTPRPTARIFAAGSGFESRKQVTAQRQRTLAFVVPVDTATEIEQGSVPMRQCIYRCAVLVRAGAFFGHPCFRTPRLQPGHVRPQRGRGRDQANKRAQVAARCDCAWTENNHT